MEKLGSLGKPLHAQGEHIDFTKKEPSDSSGQRLPHHAALITIPLLLFDSSPI